MKFLKILLGLLIVVGAVLAVVAPIGPLPGFFIGGTKAPAPEKWMDTSGIHEIKLGVAGSLPRVVIIWVVEHDEELYVVGSSDSGWVKMLGQGGPVNMRLEGNTYALQARQITDGKEAVLGAYVAKYQPDYPDIIAGFGDIQSAGSAVGVFRLDRS